MTVEELFFCQESKTASICSQDTRRDTNGQEDEKILKKLGQEPHVFLLPPPNFSVHLNGKISCWRTKETL